MSLSHSYFALPNLFELLEQWFHPAVRQQQVSLRGRPLLVSWTRRAERSLAQRDQPLLVEMQLYFSCVVKKRLLFHENGTHPELEPVAVNPQLQVAFRPVEANSCDPVEFAANFPVRREFHSHGATMMHPSRLHIDCNGGGWSGEYTI